MAKVSFRTDVDIDIPDAAFESAQTTDETEEEEE